MCDDSGAMRDAPYLHAKHLDEAVRQQVITSEQREALDALARTMKAAEPGAMPDFGWFRWMLAGATAAAVGLPGLVALTAVHTMHASEVMAVGLLAVGVTAGGAAMLRDRHEHAMVKGVLAAGATSFAWLLGAGAGLATFGLVPFTPTVTLEDLGLPRDQLMPYHLPLWTVPGDLTVLGTALVLGRWLRAPTVCLPAALALTHAIVRFGTYVHVTLPYQRGELVRWSDDAQLPWWIGASVVVAAAARWLDRRFTRGYDPAFWVHLGAPAGAVVGTVLCADGAPAAVAALLALGWGAVVGLAFVWRRVAWIAWGTLGVFLTIVAWMKHLFFGDMTPVIAGLPLFVAAFAVVAARWRRHMAATATGADERLLWG